MEPTAALPPGAVWQAPTVAQRPAGLPWVRAEPWQLVAQFADQMVVRPLEAL